MAKEKSDKVMFEKVEANLRSGIDAVLSGKIKEFECLLGTAGMAVVYLEKLGWEKGDLDTNGWQYDWWLPFAKDGKSYTASGGGFYGGFKFHETEAA